MERLDRWLNRRVGGPFTTIGHVQSPPLAAADPPDHKQAPRQGDRWTVLEVLRWTSKRFEERGLATPRLDAELLIAAALALPRVQLYVQFERPLDPSELSAIRAHVRRRQAGESVAYVVGHKEFFGLDFAVDNRVLVPRPDTETLVDEALARLREGWGVVVAAAGAGVPVDHGSLPVAPPADAPEDPTGAATEAAPPPRPLARRRSPSLATVLREDVALKIADIGTGSGAIAITLAKQIPGATLFAVDSSASALDVARANAARHGVSVTFLHGDLATPLGACAPLELIAANLPYVPSAEIAGLAPEVRSEPRQALDGGPDGLDLVRRLITQAPALLAPGGALVLEIGAGQAEQTAALCRAAGLVDVRLRRDLGAVDRVVSAVKP